MWSSKYVVFMQMTRRLYGFFAARINLILTSAGSGSISWLYSAALGMKWLRETTYHLYCYKGAAQKHGAGGKPHIAIRTPLLLLWRI